MGLLTLIVSAKIKSIMKYAILICVISIAHCSFCQEPVNAVALKLGSTMIEIPKSMAQVTDRVFLDKYSSGALFDESKNVWSSQGTSFPFVFVMELAEEFNIQKLEFDNRCEFYPGIEAKNIKVEFSTEGPDSGFKTVSEYTLEKEKLNKVKITPQKTRWIKLSVLDNYGNKERVQLAEFRAIGVPGNRIGETVDINGVWHTNWQDMTFVQEGKSFTGKYIYTSDSRKYKGKVKNGVIYRNGITFNWNEGNASGTAVLFMNKEGSKISGLWQNDHHEKDFNVWSMTRNVEESKEIEYSESIEPEIVVDNSAEEETAIVPEVAVPSPTIAPVAAPVETIAPTKPKIKIGDTDIEEIKAGEAIVMKNINFKLGAATVNPDSYPELDVLFDFMQSNKNSKIKVNGHTDKIGDPKKNIMLSQARANAIKKYLTNKGINKNRIRAVGVGDTQTLCPSPCPENRRVDFVLIEN